MRWLAQHVRLWDAHPSPEEDVPAHTNGKPPPGTIHFKTTERFVGFLVYVSGTYTMFVLYLKGIYLTLNSWRPGRTTDGWPLPGFERDLSEVVKYDLVLPIWVKIVPRLESDLETLLKLTGYKKPPEIPIVPFCDGPPTSLEILQEQVPELVFGHKGTNASKLSLADGLRM